MTGFPEWSATAYCLFMATIVSTKTMTSLRLRAKFRPYIFKLESLQLNRVKFSRKSSPRVGKAFILNNPLCNLKGPFPVTKTLSLARNHKQLTKHSETGITI